ncbi:MAG: hypothetical protein CSA11_10715 [Chloroflexi bacterium]|nr:MAG: hypothetical protein CSB13_03705 [Chloroflexota bacterium]PIE79775.1 MAG: hypothetical protein CSA11_10715 [Chloroflexota bacterium]
MKVENRSLHKNRLPQILSRMRSIIWFSLLFLFVLAHPAVSKLGSQTAWGQEPPPDLIEITQVDDHDFPLIAVSLLTLNRQGGPVDLTNASLRENGIPVEFETAYTAIGLDAIFVIDANETLLGDDNGDGITRAAQVTESINQFSRDFLRPELDSVSVVVPDDLGVNGRFLVQESSDPQAIQTELNDYTPLAAWPTPLQDMLLQAVELAVVSKENGRYPVILLFTDAGRLHLQLDYNQLLEPAVAHDIPISGAILGTTATAEEQLRINRLSQPTRGTTLHMPDSAAIVPLLTLWQQQGQQPQLLYQSLQNQGGQYPIAINWGQQRVTSELNLELLPPHISILPTTYEITRSGTHYDTPITDLEPTQTIIPVQVAWPDDKPRALTAVVWQVNGVRQPPMNTLKPNADGQLMLRWNLELADEGSYEFIVDVADEYGFSATSEIVTIQLVTERPLPPTGTPLPTATPTPEPVTVDSLNISLWLPVLGMLGITAVVLLLLRSHQANKSQHVEEEAETFTHPPSLPAEPPQPTISFAAFLDPVNQPEKKPIRLQGDNIIIGRDKNEASIILIDKSIARLHARITCQQNSYWLYDEGSAQGTYLNYTRLSLTPKEITDNDIIGIGRLQFRFSLQPIDEQDEEE